MSGKCSVKKVAPPEEFFSISLSPFSSLCLPSTPGFAWKIWNSGVLPFFRTLVFLIYFFFCMLGHTLLISKSSPYSPRNGTLKYSDLSPVILISIEMFNPQGTPLWWARDDLDKCQDHNRNKIGLS